MHKTVKNDNQEVRQFFKSSDSKTEAQSSFSLPPIGVNAHGNSAELTLIQRMEEEHKPNRTGIPDATKERFENLSGFSFDDVRVHYNSDKPAQLQALAYTQGNQVYVGPGQEKHLGHELGHVVQQKQGRISPTIQVNGFSVNDDSFLERDADRMGTEGVTKTQMPDNQLPIGNNNNLIVQCTSIRYENLEETAPNIYKFFNMDSNKKLWRFTNDEDEIVPVSTGGIGAVEEHARGANSKAVVKPRSFGANLAALIAATCLKGDKNLLRIFAAVDNLIELDVDKASEECDIYAATSNEMTLFETECIVYSKEKQKMLSEISGFKCHTNPFKLELEAGRKKEAKAKQKLDNFAKNPTEKLKKHFGDKMSEIIPDSKFEKIWDEYDDPETEDFSIENVIHSKYKTRTIALLQNLLKDDEKDEDEEDEETEVSEDVLEQELYELGLV